MPPCFCDAEAAGDEGGVDQAGIRRRVGTAGVIVAEGGGLVDEGAAGQIDAHQHTQFFAQGLCGFQNGGAVAATVERHASKAPSMPSQAMMKVIGPNSSVSYF